MRAGRAWTRDLLWQLAYEAALHALARTIIDRAHGGGTARAHGRRRRRRRAGAA